MLKPHGSLKNHTAYHIHTNGLTKCLSKTIAVMLPMYIEVEHKMWKECVPHVKFVCHTAVQETLQMTPSLSTEGS